MLAGYKNGGNIIGTLEADQMENVLYFTLKNNFTEVLGKNFNFGHT
jgi:hypothetical protein